MTKFVNVIQSAIVGFSVLLFVAGACAEEAPLKSEDIKVTTPVYHAHFSDFKQRLGTYKYEVSWQGIPAAELEVKVDRQGTNFHISSSAKTYKAIDIFYKLRYSADALISAVDLLPIRSVYHHRENSKVKDTEIIFLPDGEIQSVYRRSGKEPEYRKFNPENFTLGPFSAAFLARSLNWEKGEVKIFDTFDGRNRYLISLTAEDKVTMRINGQEREVWVISPEVKKLNTNKKHEKLRKASIFVTADDAREILLIKSEVFIGSVKTKLVSFSPAAGYPTSVAKRKTRGKEVS